MKLNIFKDPLGFNKIAKHNNPIKEDIKNRELVLAKLLQDRSNKLSKNSTSLDLKDYAKSMDSLNRAIAATESDIAKDKSRLKSKEGELAKRALISLAVAGGAYVAYNKGKKLIIKMRNKRKEKENREAIEFLEEHPEYAEYIV